MTRGMELVRKRGQGREGEGGKGVGGRFDLSAVTIKEVANILMDMMGWTQYHKTILVKYNFKFDSIGIEIVSL